MANTHMHHSCVIVISDPHSFTLHKYWIFDDLLIDGAWHLGGPPSAVHCTLPQEGVVPDSSFYFRGSVWASRTDKMVNANTNVWLTYFFQNGAPEGAPIEKWHVYVKCVSVCVCVLWYLFFLLQSDFCLPSRDCNDGRQHWLVAR